MASCWPGQYPHYEVHGLVVWVSLALLLAPAVARRRDIAARAECALIITLLLISLVVRAMWFTLRGCGYRDSGEWVVNRLGMLLVFTAFASYLLQLARISLYSTRRT